ncbi:MAG TPA: hypothetical protein VFN49_03360 [Candidatus Aquilonibacter sp.]|nr:hypothetical protein [Candidatus Aquilonibacter sp.]
MSTSTSLAPAARTALEGLIDYAGLFPPARLDMAASVAEYLACRNGPYAWMLGGFVVPASRIEELLGCAHPETEAIPISAIVDAGNDPRSWFGKADAIFDRLASYAADEQRIAIDALEVPLPTLASARDTYEATVGQAAMLAEKYGLRTLPIYVEVPRDARWRELLTNTAEALWRYDLYGKIRCGGVTADAYPSAEELAAYIAADREYGGGFKATAGLHHPVRHENPSAGVMMHGFLNILFAAAVADFMELPELVEIVADTDASHFALSGDEARYRDRAIPLEALETAREHFISYGSCSFAEPVEDLINLSILPKA